MLATLAAIAAFTTVAHAEGPDWAQVDDALGRKAAVSQDVHRYGFPRTDLNVTLDGVTIKPALALGGWVAFKPMGKDAMLMGDLVLTESEINPVMAKLLADGLQITAVHNHLLRATPATFYMHVGGHGDPVKMAIALREALALSKTPGVVAPATIGQTSDLDLDTAALDNAIGAKGKATGGVYQFSVPRTDVISEDHMTVPPALGAAHAVNFQPTGDGKAAITGDFIALSNEVVPLITALRQNDIEVTAIHNHMLDDEPRTFFIHFWANDDAQKLAQGIRAALETTKADLKQ
ncbi:DUF1259 domain-containing protein [Bradyrhizobium sp. SYSU BS000235]|uniref:DUF1259 domain-containing protein n=1 Tax=Bradyrhizobium sp. SYSU BS000235 TaxID=3411332 RepID=UPI003C792C33